MSVISVRQLAFGYSSSLPVLRGIDLDVPERSLFGLLGPNGAGKTTFLSILAGLIPCPPGCLFVDGRDWADPANRAATRLALVPQEYAFYNPLTVRENLTFFAGVQGVTKAETEARIQTAVAKTGLQERLHSRAGTLSGGLKRRLNLAIGLLNEPRLLLLDVATGKPLAEYVYPVDPVPFGSFPPGLLSTQGLVELVGRPGPESGPGGGMRAGAQKGHGLYPGGHENPDASTWIPGHRGAGRIPDL